MDDVSVPVEIGSMLAGKYRVERVLGRGGMGVVIAATHVQLEQRVAIKFLLPQALANADVVARFQREARAAVKIQSEHVARIIDVGTLDSGAPYMVMEYLEGTDLAHKIASDGQVAVRDAVQYVLQACEALAEAHSAGIVHRDLKPANLFLARRADKTSIVKVLDFGISKSATGAGGAVTSTQAIMGSPYYMSPEQLMSSKHVDARSDVWSLGIVLYESLVGSPPYVADTMPEIIAQILQAPTPSVRAKRPDAPVEIDRIIGMCLAKDANARYRDVAALARDLAALVPDGTRSVERISRVLGTSLPPAAEPAAAASGAATSSQEGRGGTVAMTGAAATSQPQAAWGTTHIGLPKRSGARVAALAAGALVLVAILVGLVVWSRSGTPKQVPSGITESPAATSLPAMADPLPKPVVTTEPAAITATAALPTFSATPHVGAGVGRPSHAASVASAAQPAPSKTTGPAVVAPPPTQTARSALDMGIK